MKYIFLVILCIVLVIVSLYALYSMRNEFLKVFEEECYNAIKKRDKEYEEQEEFNRSMKKWLFK